MSSTLEHNGLTAAVNDSRVIIAAESVYVRWRLSGPEWSLLTQLLPFL